MGTWQGFYLPKPAVKSATVWTNLLVVVLPVLFEFVPELKDSVCSNQSAYALSVIGLLNVALRFKSKEGISIKKQKGEGQ